MDGTGDKPTLGVIGAGRVGGALARAWTRAGYRVTAVYSRTPAHARTLADAVNAEAVPTPLAVIARCDLALLTVTDDAIAPIAQTLIGAEWSGRGVVHTSGAHSLYSLAALRSHGAMVGSLHPAFPFANAETAISGVTFALESSHPALEMWLMGLVAAVGGRAFVLQPEQKALYHAALAIASNYTVTLYATAQRLLTELGASRETADNALNALMTGTLDNLKKQGIPDALTGPLVREDVGTIAAHLVALAALDPHIAETYRHLARLTYPLLSARGVSVETIEATLNQDKVNNRESNNT